MNLISKETLAKLKVLIRTERFGQTCRRESTDEALTYGPPGCGNTLKPLNVKISPEVLGV